MPERIGEVFSPQFLSVVAQRAEGAADRNFKAAMMERELDAKRETAKMQAQADMFGQQVRAAGQGSSDKAAIEAMKEEGRMKRSSEANALKEALKTKDLEFKGLQEERRTLDSEAQRKLREAQARYAGERAETTAQMRDPLVEREHQKIKEHAAAMTRARELHSLDTQKEYAGIQKLYTEIAGLTQLAEYRKDDMRLKKIAQAAQLIKADKDGKIDQAKLKLAWAKLTSNFGIYNQSMEQRAKESPALKEALLAMSEIAKMFPTEVTEKGTLTQSMAQADLDWMANAVQGYHDEETAKAGPPSKRIQAKAEQLRNEAKEKWGVPVGAGPLANVPKSNGATEQTNSETVAKLAKAEIERIKAARVNTNKLPAAEFLGEVEGYEPEEIGGRVRERVGRAAEGVGGLLDKTYKGGQNVVNSIFQSLGKQGPFGR